MKIPRKKKATARPRRSPFTAELPDLKELPRGRLALMAGALQNRISKSFSRWLDRHLTNEWDLTGPRLMLVALINRNESLTMSEAAELLDVTPRAITRLVDGLAKQGFVTRTASATDKRVFDLHVTAAGKTKLTKVLPIHEGRMGELYATFTDEELREYIRLQSKFLHRLKELGEGED